MSLPAAHAYTPILGRTTYPGIPAATPRRRKALRAYSLFAAPSRRSADSRLQDSTPNVTMPIAGSNLWGRGLQDSLCLRV
jgi:hypothetical protein